MQVSYDETLEVILKTFREGTALFVIIETLWEDTDDFDEFLEDWR